MIKQFSVTTLVVATLVLAACKKEKGIEAPPTPPPPTVTAADKMKDTAILYARDIYLWNTQIPSSFNARQYADLDKVMQAIRPYSKEPGFTDPVDKWSFAYKKADWDNVSGGVAKDFGLNVFFLAEGDLRVKGVEKNSPAGAANIHRGWRIKGINGNTNMTTANANYIVENVFYSNGSTFDLEKPDGSTITVNLTAATYEEQPIYLDTVYVAGAKRTGYMVFNSFLGDTAKVFNSFQRIFNRFATEQVNEVIVDLRYNGGGFVNVHDKLANYLVPTAGNGGIMMKRVFNSLYSSWNESTNYTKLGTLNIPRIFFIVSSSTASASELLINNLKPYMDVKVVGPNATYGKPVGYFPIGIGDWYIFPVSFRSTNKNNEGNYFNGFPLDKQVADGLDKDWGDRQEASLASALKFIETGSFAFNPPGETIGSTNTSYKKEAVIKGNRKIDEHEFKGAVDMKRRF